MSMGSMSKRELAILEWDSHGSSRTSDVLNKFIDKYEDELLKDGLFRPRLRVKVYDAKRYYEKIDGLLGIVELHLVKWRQESKTEDRELPCDLESLSMLFQKGEINIYHVRKQLNAYKQSITLNKKPYYDEIRKMPLTKTNRSADTVARFFDLKTGKVVDRLYTDDNDDIFEGESSQHTFFVCDAYCN